MTDAVRFNEYGAVDVLRVVDVERPVPGPGQVVVEMRAASINPGEIEIREGLLHHLFPATFPSGEGSDLAGVVVEVGPGVTRFATGDEVFGYTDLRASHAQLVPAFESELAPKPAGLSWEVAGSLYVAGSTAWAMVRAVDAGPGDTVVVTGAAGGVGSLAVQLARRAGATVIGVAGPRNHEWLASRGVSPVAYGDGVAERILAVGKPDALIDPVGGGYVELGVTTFGIAPERIDTLNDYEAAERYGAKTDGNAEGARIEVIVELADLAARGELDVTIAATYPLREVRAAYTELAAGHTRGKIVLVNR
ncbi:NADP-dependent oxidoreductase [Cryptosporangium arvum]|uniref:NADP-dependent oxidoreductase n=1 Tax=Cryptosporangium arvum TaxID=80871 RepID=UPI0004BCBC30|nr:NADP-dependent oxidoreductase [Cryptosporangium arvum]